MTISNKSDFYKAVIDITKKTGQGLTGIVFMKKPEWRVWLDELVEEGLLIEMHQKYSTLPDDVFIMPTKGYNLWKEDEEMDALTCVRVFLGAEGGVTFGGDKNGELINLTTQDLIRMPEFVERYSKWLTKNIDELNEMLNLDDVYDVPDMCLDPKEVEWVKTHGWYKKNKLVSECIKNSDESIGYSDEMIVLHKKLIKIYDAGNEGDKIKEANEEIEKLNSENLTRKRFRMIFEGDSDKNIQDVLK